MRTRAPWSVDSAQHRLSQRRQLLLEPDVVEVPAAYEIPPPRIPWSLELFGERPVEALQLPQSKLERAQRLFPEARLHVRRDQ